MPAVVAIPMPLPCPIGDVPRPVACVAVGVEADDEGEGEDEGADAPPFRPLGTAPARCEEVGAPGCAALPGRLCPTGMIANSSLVIGSLYFFRRKRCSTRT